MYLTNPEIGLTTRIADLDTSLTDMDGDDFAHDIREESCNGTLSHCSRTATKELTSMVVGWNEEVGNKRRWWTSR
jgi:hypothetical protein